VIWVALMMLLGFLAGALYTHHALQSNWMSLVSEVMLGLILIL
jgi:hypothetical protein